MNVELITFLSFLPLSIEFELVILHTNDVHSRFEEHNGNGGPCADDGMCYGGMPRLATAVQKYRNDYENVIFLDGGDQFQGSIWYTILKWTPIAAAVTQLKYSAISFGNHEFDDGLEGLLPYLQNVSQTVPVVNSNVYTDGKQLDKLYKKFIILDVAGEKIGIIGYLTEETEFISNPGETVHFNDVIESVQDAVNQLKNANINKIIAVGHAGINVDRALCKNVPGLDVVVGGHTNTFLYNGDAPTGQKPGGTYPEVLANSEARCLVVQDYAFAKWLGFLKIQFNADGIISSYEGNPILLDDRFQNDQNMEKLLEPFKAQLEKYKSTQIGVAAVALDGSRESCRLRECNLGNIVTDAMVYAYTKDVPEEEGWTTTAIGVINGGGIRDFQSKVWTKLTLEDLYSIHPFGNTIEMVTLKGLTIRKMLERSVHNYNVEDANGRFLQMSGLKVVYDLSKTNGHRVVSVMARCMDCMYAEFEPLNDDKIYNVVTISYLINGGDGFTMIKEEKIESDGAELTDLDVLETYVKHHDPITTGLEGRISFIDADKNAHIDILTSKLQLILLLSVLLHCLIKFEYNT